MLQSVDLTVLWLPLVAVVFRLIERTWRWTAENRVNVTYWFVGFLVVKPVTRAAQGLILGGLFAVTSIYAVRVYTYTALATQPLLLQAIELIVVGDFMQYWWHRFMHTRVVWRYHSVHHSTVQLSWLGAVRHHPLEEIVGSVILGFPLLLMGFNTAVVVAWIPVSTFIDWLAHADIKWDFGPFRYVLASPAYHRWHHAIAPVDKNFAQLFPVWDVLFGTAWFPAGRQPKAYGVVSNDVPETFLGQMLHPWVKNRKN